jgi:hypothetical protein
VSDDTAFDPYTWMNDASEACLMAESDDSFECTYPPPDYSCPSFTFESEGNAYDIVVASFGSCVDEETGGYSISIDADSDPDLTLSADDAGIYENMALTPWTVSVSGTATMSQ